nr:MAG: hypothetical protein 2 [Tombusviridae sp.]
MTKTKKNKVVVQIRPRRQAKPAKRTTPKSNQQISAIGQALRALGGIGGSAAGAFFGAPGIGGTVGTGLGASLSRWLGSGDYTVSSNSLVSKAASGTIPSMHREGQSIIVRHKEFVTEVRGAINFTVRNQLAINPGMATTFPWLSGLASQYSEYKVRGMVYHYVPTSGTAVASTNAALGSVMIQTSYRATEAVATSKVEMLNEYWSSESVPSSDFCHPIECDPKENPFNIQYIRAGKLPTTENQLMYDLGRTTVAVSGQQVDDKVLGDLWISYEIELKKPVLANANNSNIQSYASFNTVGLNAAAPFGTPANMAERFSNLPVEVTFTSTQIIFAPGLTGTFMVVVYYQGATNIDVSSWAIANGTLVAAVAGASSVGSDFTVGTGMGMNSTWFTVTDAAVSCVLTQTLATLVGASSVRVYLTEANPNNLNP